MNRKNKKIKTASILFFLSMTLTLLMGCGTNNEKNREFLCYVVLEEGTGFSCETYTAVGKKGEDIQFLLELEDGYLITNSDYEKYSITSTVNGTGVNFTLHEVEYSTAVTLTVEKSGASILYYGNGGERLDGGNKEEGISVGVLTTHLRVNTALGHELFIREGYTQIGWNTKEDGSGRHIGIGSRVTLEDEGVLYAEWSKWTNEKYFEYQNVDGYAIITGYNGNEETLSIPETLDGNQVVAIEEGACRNATCRTLILPRTIQRIEASAFQSSAVQELYLYDSIDSINDYVFEGCENLQSLHINAMEEPVYSGSYFDTFQDKYDRLLQLDGKKIVLFSGSSTRFGFDSPMIDDAFPEYEVFNMGVFAYSNALPQLLLILDQMDEGDLLLHAPEFDTSKRQFCTTNDLDASFFAMMESNYDTIANLDIRMFQKVFFSLNSYLQTKEGMVKKNYTISASNFDEEGNSVLEPSYNIYGDYILYRENAVSDAPIYNLPVEYRVEAFSKELYIDSINRVYAMFLEQGITVYFTYAPRNKDAISKESGINERKELHEYFQETLLVPVISDMEDSLLSGTYFYGTDNHLSTEGVKLRTEKIIEDLKKQMSLECDEVSDES